MEKKACDYICKSYMYAKDLVCILYVCVEWGAHIF